MDLLDAGCQGLGLALAAGALPGAPAAGHGRIRARARRGRRRRGPVRALAHRGGPPGLAGLADRRPGAGFAFLVARDVAGEPPAAADGAGEGASIGLAALALAGLSVLVPPSPCVALGGLVWLFLGRRAAGQKYEGLRSLR